MLKATIGVLRIKKCLHLEHRHLNALTGGLVPLL